MSFKLVAQVMDIKVGSPLRKIILIKLADQANDEGSCWPSYDSIAKTCEISKRSVITHIQKLEKQGFLRIEKRYNKDAGKNFSNKYHLTLSKGSANDAPLEGGANAALVQMSVEGSEGDSLGGEGAAPEPINEPINEPVNKEVGAKKDKSTFNALSYPVPSFVDKENWNDFVEMRKRIKKPLTETSCKRLVNKIIKLDEDGFDVNDSLDYSITGDYQTVFERKRKTNNFQGNTHANNQPANSKPRRETTEEYKQRMQREFNQEFGIEVQPGSHTDCYS